MFTSLLWPTVGWQSIHVGNHAPVGESGRAGPLWGTERSDGCDSGGRRWGTRRGEGRRVGRGHGGRRFGRGGGLGQEGGLLVGAGPGREPDRRLGLGQIPVMQETGAGVVARTGPTEVWDVVVVGVVVQLLREVGVGVLLRVRELQRALAEVVQGVEGGVVAGRRGGGGAGRGGRGRGQRRLVDVGERFERQVRAVVQRPRWNRAVDAWAKLHEARRRFLKLFVSGGSTVTRERRSNRFTRCSNFTLLSKRERKKIIWNGKKKQNRIALSPFCFWKLLLNKEKKYLIIYYRNLPEVNVKSRYNNLKATSFQGS